MATSSTDTDGAKSGVDIKKANEKGYDKIATAYLNWATKTPGPRIEATQKLIDLLPKTKATKVLELGCGAGVPATQLLAQHFTVTGNDMLGSPRKPKFTVLITR